MPRFFSENYSKNLQLLDGYVQIAREVGCTPAQLALAWLLAKDPAIVPIPGTRHPEYVIENVATTRIRLEASTVQRLDAFINQHTVVGDRYPAATQQEIDTENF